MGMQNGKYYLSNSEMNDWKTMCPLVWKAKYIDRILPSSDDDPEISVMDWGILFETLAIGSGVQGKTINDAKLAKMKKSEYYTRVVKQAEDCRDYFKHIGGKIIARQPYLYVEVTLFDDVKLLLCGGLDALMSWKAIGIDKRNLIIDTKLTGDNDNDFGKYQFGNVSKVNPQQAIHYTILHEAKYKENAAFQYWVFDKSPSMKQKIINVVVSDFAKEEHLEKCRETYNEISFSLEMDDWGFKNTFENCRDCQVPCANRRLLPDVIDLET